MKLAFYTRKGMIAKGDVTLYTNIVTSLIHNNVDIDIYFVNYSENDYVTELMNHGVKYIDSENMKELDECTYVTAFNQLLFLTEDIKNINSKILLLFLHPQTIRWFLEQFKYKPDISELLELIHDTNSYGFQDESNILALKQYTSLPFEKKFFPPVIVDTIQLQHSKNVQDEEINVGWFGRLDGDKIYSFINMLDNLMELNYPRINVHIIGDGDSKKKIDVKKYSSKIVFIFTSYLYGEIRDRYIKNNVDLVLSMGMSSITCASLGIPTILPIVSSVRFNNDEYVFFYDTINYSVGWSEQDLRLLKCKTYRLSEIMDRIYKYGLKEQIGLRCARFVKEKFSVNAHISEILSTIMSTRLTVKDCYNIPFIAKQIKNAHKFNKKTSTSTYSDYVTYVHKEQKRG